ncbi:MAG: DMT family transporter [Ktedonobacteraceae bacterium]|nr:DMT family transporter [Ktedonobacteraceae bacterium]
MPSGKPDTDQLVTQDTSAHLASVRQEAVRRPNSLGIGLVLLLATLIWGSTFLVVQRTITLTGPFTFLALRFSIGALTLALIYHRRLIHLTRYELCAGSLMGIILFASYATQTLGLQYTTTSMAGFLTGLYVPFVPLLSILLLRRWPALGAMLGIVLSFCGLTLLSLNEHFALSFGPGEMLILACAVGNALHIVLISKYAPRADAINLSLVQIAITALLSFVAMPIAREPFVLPSWPVWLSCLFMGVLATAFCLAAMNRIQQFISSERATLAYALEPVWTALFGYLAGERLGLLAWIGCGCILLAMLAGNLKLRLFKR